MKRFLLPMKRWTLAAVFVLIACAALWAAEAAPQLTPAQELVFQKALSGFYLAASNLNAASAQLERSKAQLVDARKELSLSCPGEIVDIEGKPAECKLKTPEVAKKDELK